MPRRVHPGVIAVAVAATLTGCGSDSNGAKTESKPPAEEVTVADAADLAECLTGAGFDAVRDNSANPFKGESTTVRATPLDDPETRVTLFVFATPEDLDKRRATLEREYPVFSATRQVGLATADNGASRRAKKEIEGSGCLPS